MQGHVYAAFFGHSTPVINVWDIDRSRLEQVLADRRANGDAFPDERIERVPVAAYNRMLSGMGLPVVEQWNGSRWVALEARKEAA